MNALKSLVNLGKGGKTGAGAVPGAENAIVPVAKGGAKNGKNGGDLTAGGGTSGGKPGKDCSTAVLRVSARSKCSQTQPSSGGGAIAAAWSSGVARPSASNR